MEVFEKKFSYAYLGRRIQSPYYLVPIRRSHSSSSHSSWILPRFFRFLFSRSHSFSDPHMVPVAGPLPVPFFRSPNFFRLRDSYKIHMWNSTYYLLPFMPCYFTPKIFTSPNSNSHYTNKTHLFRHFLRRIAIFHDGNATHARYTMLFNTKQYYMANIIHIMRLQYIKTSYTYIDKLFCIDPSRHSSAFLFNLVPTSRYIITYVYYILYITVLICYIVIKRYTDIMYIKFCIVHRTG